MIVLIFMYVKMLKIVVLIFTLHVLNFIFTRLPEEECMFAPLFLFKPILMK